MTDPLATAIARHLHPSTQDHRAAAWDEACRRFADEDLDAELVAHATGRNVLDNVFPPAQCVYDPDDLLRTRGPNQIPDDQWTGGAS